MPSEIGHVTLSSITSRITVLMAHVKASHCDSFEDRARTTWQYINPNNVKVSDIPGDYKRYGAGYVTIRIMKLNMTPKTV